VSAAADKGNVLRSSALAALGLVVSLLLSMSFGSDPIDWSDALADRGHARTILLDVRLPQALLAAVAGAGLGATGTAFQGLLRNPLAEPYLLGVSGGAALGATTVIALGATAASWLGAAITPVAAFAGGMLATMVVYFVARRAPRGPSGATMLLAGIMVNSICASLVTVGKLLVPPSRAKNMLSWLVGFIDTPTLASLSLMTAYVALGAVLLIRDAAQLNLLALGDEAAESLGVRVDALQRRVLVACSLAVGAIVSMTGLIGFVGLVVPHALRRTVGPDHRRLLPLSCLAGAATLVLCDCVTRVAFRAFDTKLPVGAVTALLGGPAFLHLLTRARSAA
jgi:iron complex transport system permease protein